MLEEVTGSSGPRRRTSAHVQPRHGTPEGLVDQILELQETAQLNYLLCAPLSQESFTLLTDRVLPRVG